MPWRLVKFIVIFAIFLLFVILNIGNKSDISFGFVKIRDAPVYLIVFFSVFAGMLCALPFIYRRNRKNASADIKPKPNRETAGRGSSLENLRPSGSAEEPDSSQYGID